MEISAVPSGDVWSDRVKIQELRLAEEQGISTWRFFQPRSQANFTSLRES